MKTSGGRRKRTRSGISAECRPVIKQQIAAQVLTHGDVVGRAGAEDHKWTQAHPMRQADCASHKHTMPHIEGSPPVVHGQVELIRWKTRSAGSVAVGVVQRIVAEEG